MNERWLISVGGGWLCVCEQGFLFVGPKLHAKAFADQREAERYARARIAHGKTQIFAETVH